LGVRVNVKNFYLNGGQYKDAIIEGYYVSILKSQAISVYMAHALNL